MKFGYSSKFLTLIAQNISFLRKIPYAGILVDEPMKIFMFIFRPKVFCLMVSLNRELKTWKFVDTTYHRFGGIQFNYLGNEIGHMHGNGLVDVPLLVHQKNLYIAKEKALPHHLHPNSTWVSIPIRSTKHLRWVINILQTSKANFEV